MRNLHPEDAGSMVLRNIGILPHHHTASQPRIQRPGTWKELQLFLSNLLQRQAQIKTIAFVRKLNVIQKWLLGNINRIKFHNVCRYGVHITKYTENWYQYVCSICIVDWLCLQFICLETQCTKLHCTCPLCYVMCTVTKFPCTYLGHICS